MKRADRNAVWIAILLLFCCSLFADDAGSLRFFIKAADKDGKPVSGLTLGDFKLQVDGKEKAAGCFQEIRSPEKMKLVIAIDGLNTSKYEFLEIRDQLTDFISNLDASHWQLMVIGVSSGDSAVLVPFTNNFEDITNKLEAIQANADRDKDVAQRKNLIADEIRKDPRSGRQRAYELASAFAAEEAQEVQLTLLSLSRLAKHIDPDSTGEHVSMLFISGGLTIHPGRQYLEFAGQLAGSASLGDQMQRSLTGYDERQEIKKRIGTLNHANVTVYTLNVRDAASAYTGGMRADTARFNANDPFLISDLQEGLNLVAAQTGGIAFQGSKEFEKFSAAPQQDNSDFYMICFKPDAEKKQKYHEVEINAVKDGIVTRHSKGFLSGEED